jgi:hypothetical protein
LILLSYISKNKYHTPLISLYLIVFIYKLYIYIYIHTY